jgi:endo-beta-N-acetylglucosaminidase D
MSGCSFLCTGCSTPFLTLPGKSLQGDEAVAESWEFASAYTIMQLETRPQNPYSVYHLVVLKNNNLYINAAERRRWHDYIKQDPNVRVKLGDKIYRARAVEVTDPEVLDDFSKRRTIYRLDLM